MNMARGSRGRRWRLLLARVSYAGPRFHTPPRLAEELRGCCPGCGTTIVFYATSSPLARCGHCETPLVADCEGLNIEQAVYARLYDAPASADVQQIILAANG